MPNNSLHAELIDLAFAVCDGAATDAQIDRVEQIVTADPAARLLYLQCLELHFQMDRREGVAHNEQRGSSPPQRGLGTSVPSLASDAPIIFPTASLSDPYSSVSLFSTNSLLFSYLIAALILGTALAVAGAWKLPDHLQVAVHPSLPTENREQPSDAKTTFVARITGRVDCQWSDPATAVSGPVAVPLGRKFALSSGLLEITYDSGAKVILQGPCTYEVESPASGFLSVGKLTARVEKKEERRTKNEELSASRSSFLIPTSYFAVRTPTATVTDLGTEFGVEVRREGVVDVHVFEGTVEASGIAGKLAGQTWTMKANEAMVLDPKTGASPKMCDQRMLLDPQATLRNSPQMRARTPVTVTQTDLGPTPDGLAGKLQPDDALQRAFAAGTATIRLVSGPAFQPAEYADVSRLCDAQNDSIFHNSTLGTPQDYNRVMHMFFAPADAQWAPAVYDIEFGPRYKESRDLREINIFHGPNATRSPYEFEVLCSVTASPQTFRPLAAAHNFTTRNGTLIRIVCQPGRVPDLAALRLVIHPIQLANGNWAGNSFAEIDVNFYPAETQGNPTP